jgi:ribosomal protein L11 methyltransferase
MTEFSMNTHNFQYTWRLPMIKAFQWAEDLPQCDLFESSESEDLWTLTMYVKQESDVPSYLLSEPHDIIDVTKKDWTEVYQEKLHPLTVGNFYIYAQSFLPMDNKISLKIEASTAFGSGHHETTQGCLQLIQDVFSHHPWTKAWDVGCGSGILTLAMNALIPGSACGSDNDPEAITKAEHNAKVNHIPTTFYCAEGFPPAAHSCDLVVGNLVASLLIQWAPCFETQRQMILSGILASQAEEVLETYRSLGWAERKTLTLGDWSSLWIQRL